MSFWDSNFIFGDGYGAEGYGANGTDGQPDGSQNYGAESYVADGYEYNAEGYGYGYGYNTDGGDDADGGDNGGDNADGGDDAGKKSLYETDQVFLRREDLVEWVQKIGRHNGYVIVTKRSKKDKFGFTVKVWLGCDRGGVYKGTPIFRKTGTKKTNCPFELQGKFVVNEGGWKILIVDDKHNHDADEHLEGHAYAMRLSQEEVGTVRQLSEQNIAPRNILGTLRQKNPDNKSSLKTVYNVKEKIKKSTRIGDTPMKVFFSMLDRNNYEHFDSVDESNTVQAVFFMHPKSKIMWRAFPHVLLMDSTYKTNLYKMPFVQMVGVTSTLKTFSVCHAFINLEREENFIWVLERLKSTLEDESIMPRVIVTDRDLALVKALSSVFRNSVHLLCRWHISENIGRHCKAGFSAQDWGRFEHLWSVLINSETPDMYEFNYDRLYKRLVPEHSGIYL